MVHGRQIQRKGLFSIFFFTDEAQKNFEIQK